MQRPYASSETGAVPLQVTLTAPATITNPPTKASARKGNRQEQAGNASPPEPNAAAPVQLKIDSYMAAADARLPRPRS